MMRLVRHLTTLAGATASLAPVASPLFAQASVGAPTREEIERAPVAPLPPTAGQRVTVEGEVERAPCPLAGDQFKDITVTLSGVQFDGLKGLDASLLSRAYADKIGKTLPIGSVCEIRDEAATILRRAGYLAAVQVPPQRIENGIVRFDVLMAKVVDFQVRGNAGRSEKLIAGYLQAIKDQPVFNIVEAERYLLLARDIPGYDVRLTLRPAGTAPGEVIGEVQVVYTPIEVEANVQNYGSRDVGRFGGLAQVRINGLFGAGDRTTIGGFSTADFKEQQVIQLGQEFRLGREGLTLVGDFTYAWTHPDIGPGINLRSHTLVGSLEARYPVIRRQAKNLFLSGGFDLIDQTTRFNTIPLTEDKLRVIFARLDFDSIDANSIASTNGYSASEPRWRLGGSLELRQGIGIFGASNGCGPTLAACSLPGVTPPSRVEGDPTAFVARAAAYAEFRPIPNIAFSLSPRAQYSPKALFSYEEFSTGNFTVGRGYDPGSLIGDSGVGLASEVRVGSLVPRSIKSTAFQAYGFFDAAWVWNKDTAFPPINDPQKLYSAGGGVRMAYGDRINLDLGAAFPLKRVGTQTERGDVRVLLNLSVKLLPWRRR
jgi:hemolysin activation/secretion protein